MKKFISGLKYIFGGLILLCLFAGAFSLIGYIVALFIGGDLATTICSFIFGNYLPYVIKISTVVVFIGLLIMYIEKQQALVIENTNNRK